MTGLEARGASATSLPSELGDARRLAAFLGEHGVLDEPFTARRIGDGHSNLTYRLTGADSGASVVLRRPPADATAGAHDVLREARFMAALDGTDVPVPRVLATATAGALLDVPCFVMTHVDGPVVTDRTPAPLDAPAVRREAGLSLADTLAALHAVDHRAVGLGDVGRPEGFNRRHVRRIARLVALPDDTAPSDTAPSDIVPSDTLPESFAGLHDRLVAAAPTESDATVYHGDFRLGNTVLAPDRPGRVAAVLDWELATIGDPLLDVGYLLASVPVDGEPRTPTQELGSAFDEDGWPTRAELADRYAAASGRDLSDLGWYTTLALWKVAALYEYSRRRDRDPYYRDPTFVPALLAAAHRSAEEAGL